MHRLGYRQQWIEQKDVAVARPCSDLTDVVNRTRAEDIEPKRWIDQRVQVRLLSPV
jgi:hypothetical protein